MIRLSLEEIAKATGGRVIGDATTEVFAGVETDSTRI
jgi:hypothetical protein